LVKDRKVLHLLSLFVAIANAPDKCGDPVDFLCLILFLFL